MLNNNNWKEKTEKEEEVKKNSVIIRGLIPILQWEVIK